MMKRFAYIVMLLIFASCLSFANSHSVSSNYGLLHHKLYTIPFTDTTNAKKLKQQQEEEKKKIKEIAKAKRQAKPEKIDDKDAVKPKPKRERRPEGLERPPEIPRRSGN
jgi:hypothetical protein